MKTYISKPEDTPKLEIIALLGQTVKSDVSEKHPLALRKMEKNTVVAYVERLLKTGNQLLLL